MQIAMLSEVLIIIFFCFNFLFRIGVDDPNIFRLEWVLANKAFIFRSKTLGRDMGLFVRKWGRVIESIIELVGNEFSAFVVIAFVYPIWLTSLQKRPQNRQA